MAFFKSKEEIEQEKAQRKEAEKQKALEKWHVADIEGTETRAHMEEIIESMQGLGLSSFGSMLANDSKGYQEVSMRYLEIIMKQNFEVIRLLDKIANK